MVRLVQTRILCRACLTKRKTHLRTYFIYKLSNKVLHLCTCTGLLEIRSIKREIMFYVRINRPNKLANLSYWQYLSGTCWTVSEIFSEFKFPLSLGKVSIYVTANISYLYSGAYEAAAELPQIATWGFTENPTSYFSLNTPGHALSLHSLCFMNSSAKSSCPVHDHRGLRWSWTEHGRKLSWLSQNLLFVIWMNPWEDFSFLC